MIRLINLFKTFDGKSIINNLSLDVEEGEKVAIIGPSGCGKSTLLRLIMGLHMPDSGQVFVDDQNLTRLDEESIREVRKKIGMLFQSAALFDSMTVGQNVAFPLVELTDYSQKKIKHIVAEKLEMVGMAGREDDMPSDLSGGQKKRVGLARAIAANPKIVLYDEPTTGLDPILSTSIEDLIVQLSDHLNITSVIVTHQISTILRTPDKIYLMHEKQLLPPETPQSIYKSRQEYETFINGGIETS